VTDEKQKNNDERLVQEWYLVGILMLAFVISFIDRQVITLLVEPIRRDMDISDTGISLLMGFAFAIFYVTMGVPIARLSDSRSRKAIISAGMLMWSVATAICGLTRNFWQLFMARVGVGVGEATLTPAAYSMIADSFPAKKLGRAMAVYSTGVYVGAGLAGVLGGWAVQTISKAGSVTLPILGTLHPWQLTFIIVSVPGLLLVAVMGLTVREPARKNVQTDTGGKAIPFRTVLAFMWLNKRTFGSIFVAYAFSGTAFYGYLSWIPEFIRRTHGWEIGKAGMLFGAIYAVFGTLGTLTGGWICDWMTRKGYKDAAIRACTIFFAIATPFIILTPLMPTMQLVIPMMAAMAFTKSMQQAMTPVAIQLITPNEMRAQATSIFFVASVFPAIAFGATSVALITDFVFQDDGAIRYSLSIVGAVMMICATLSLAFHTVPEAAHTNRRQYRADNCERVTNRGLVAKHGVSKECDKVGPGAEPGQHCDQHEQRSDLGPHAIGRHELDDRRREALRRRQNERHQREHDDCRGIPRRQWRQRGDRNHCAAQQHRRAHLGIPVSAARQEFGEPAPEVGSGAAEEKQAEAVDGPGFRHREAISPAQEFGDPDEVGADHGSEGEEAEQVREDHATIRAEELQDFSNGYRLRRCKRGVRLHRHAPSRRFLDRCEQRKHEKARQCDDEKGQLPGIQGAYDRVFDGTGIADQ
jgi:MFS family permease